MLFVVPILYQLCYSAYFILFISPLFSLIFMHYAYSGMFTSGYQRNPLEHCFMDAKEYGYDYIELWGGRPHAYAPDLKAGDINEVRRCKHSDF